MLRGAALKVRLHESSNVRSKVTSNVSSNVRLSLTSNIRSKHALQHVPLYVRLNVRSSAGSNCSIVCSVKCSFECSNECSVECLIEILIEQMCDEIIDWWLIKGSMEWRMMEWWFHQMVNRMVFDRCSIEYLIRRVCDERVDRMVDGVFYRTFNQTCWLNIWSNDRLNVWWNRLLNVPSDRMFDQHLIEFSITIFCWIFNRVVHRRSDQRFHSMFDWMFHWVVHRMFHWMSCRTPALIYEGSWKILAHTWRRNIPGGLHCLLPQLQHKEVHWYEEQKILKGFERVNNFVNNTAYLHNRNIRRCTHAGVMAAVILTGCCQGYK